MHAHNSKQYYCVHMYINLAIRNPLKSLHICSNLHILLKNALKTIDNNSYLCGIIETTYDYRIYR